ncbi:MAG: Zn-ribbon domain-containing OB-fold protein [Deltaproteobacteria bacterium]|nr:Zn-ribbon domain-containing OB-fold protein [Deltaproteobacteria bacterium]
MEQKPNLIEKPFTLVLPCSFSTGPFMGRFLQEIKENKRLVGNKCPQCGRTMLPPRIVCALCHVEAGDWVELSDKGSLVSFDIVYIPTINPMTGKIREVPYATGNILLDGGDATIWHFLEEKDPAKIRVGMRLQAVFREEGRVGDITDIVHFRTIEE